MCISSAVNGMNGAQSLAISKSAERSRGRDSFRFRERRSHQLEKSSATNFSIARATVVTSYWSNFSLTSKINPFSFDNSHLSKTGDWRLAIGDWPALSAYNL